MIIIIINSRNRNRHIQIRVSESTSIRELKRMVIQRRMGYSYDCQLKFGGRLLRDDDLLCNYEIEDGDEITVNEEIPIAGGPPIVNQTYSPNINCMDKRGKIGESYGYKIKGSNEGTVWGDSIYSDDSNIAKAAVLEGKCNLGEEKLVVIKIIEGKSSYGSCSKNGISTSSWGNWEGSYIFE